MVHAGAAAVFIFWPPVGPGVRRLRVIVTTFREAAWADVALPGR